MARIWQPLLRAALVPVAVALLVLGVPGPPVRAATPEPGGVSGVVTAGGAPLAAAWVVLTPVTEAGDWAGEPSQTTTDQSGHYVFPTVSSAQVKVHVRVPLTGDYVATYWPGVHTFSQAGTIPVSAEGFVADIDLPEGWSIEGRVVADDTGEPVEGARLVARIAEASWSQPAGRVEPGGGPGHFEISGLPPVDVRLYVQVPPSSPFLGDGYWSNGNEAGTRVEPAGDVTGLVIRLPRGGEISGTVRDDAGEPVVGATVRIENCNIGCPRDTTTDGSGAYRVRGIAPSPRMIVHSWAAGMIDQWFDRADDWIAATPLAVDPGEVRSGVDFALIRQGVLLGQVQAGDTGRPLAGVPAFLESVSDPRRRIFASYTDEDPHHYRIGPVPPGSYRLVLRPNSSQTAYRPVRWLRATGIGASGVIRVVAGQESEVVVTLARSRPALPGCRPADAWHGLFGGFLDPDPWPWVPACVPTTDSTAPRVGTQRD